MLAGGRARGPDVSSAHLLKLHHVWMAQAAMIQHFSQDVLVNLYRRSYAQDVVLLCCCAAARATCAARRVPCGHGRAGRGSRAHLVPTGQVLDRHQLSGQTVFHQLSNPEVALAELFYLRVSRAGPAPAGCLPAGGAM